MPTTPPGNGPYVVAERYELRARLGSGGSGVVWRAYDRALDREVAVKLLHADLAQDPDAATRFRTEATAAAKLTHPHAVLVYDLGRTHDADFLVMELVEGASLADVLLDGPLAADVAAAVATMIAGALGIAHDAGIVHRDVKPANVLLTEEGVAKLADFGIARALGEVSSRLTRTGTVLGTARYLAPEQLRDDPIDVRADIYSLGLVLHEALTGQPPFGEGGPVEVASRRLTMSLPPVSALVDGVPPGLDDAVAWAIRRDPRERPDDGSAFAAALRPYASPAAARSIAARVERTLRRGGGTASGPATQADPGQPDPAPFVAAVPQSDGTHLLAGVGMQEPAASSSDAPATDAGQRADPTSAMHPPPVPPERRSRGRLVSQGIAVVLALIALVTIGAMITQFDLIPPRDGGDGDQTGEGLLAIADAGYHTVAGSPENPDQVSNAYDGNPDTSWSTQGYNTAAFGNLKPGVGMWVTLEDTAAIERVVLQLSASGGRLELWVGEDPPSGTIAPEDWGRRVGEGEIRGDAEQRIRFDFDDREVTARTLLFWFTELPPFGDDGRHRNGIRQIEIAGG